LTKIEKEKLDKMATNTPKTAVKIVFGAMTLGKEGT
jgi:hypothetical protein